MNNTALKTAQQYRQLNIQTSVASASSHQLIEMLFDGVRDRLNQAKGCIERNDIASRNKAINAAVEILGGLQSSLDFEEGGDIANNLDALYDYMQRRLFRANADNDPSGIHEVSDLVETIRSAWSAIADAPRAT